jgi:hypothetical protein
VSLHAMTWAISQQDIPPAEKFVLLAISDLADPYNVWRGDLDGVQSFTNFEIDEASRLTDLLVMRGLIVRARNGIGYKLQCPEDEPIIPFGYKKKPIPQALRKAVFERDGYRCKRCDGHIDLCADHIHPESKGGEMSLENLQTLCRTCNSKKGAR